MPKWSQEDKLRAVSVALQSSPKRASKETGIPEPTIRRLVAEHKKRRAESDHDQIGDRSDQNDQIDQVSPSLDMMNENDDLTIKQRMFVKEYLVDLNATQAAIRAGYKAKNADTMATQLLRKPWVAEAVQRAIEERMRRTDINADKVISELAHIAFDDIRNYLRFYSDDDGNIKVQVKDSEEVDTRSISEVSLGRDGQFRFKMYAKDTALVQLGKHLGLFNEKMEVKHSGEVTTKNEQHYHVTQEVVAAAPELIDSIFAVPSTRGTATNLARGGSEGES